MSAFLIGVLAFLLLLLFLLAIPLTLSFQVSWYNAFQGHVKLQWFFGLVRFRFNPFDTEQTAAEATVKKGEDWSAAVEKVDRRRRKKQERKKQERIKSGRKKPDVFAAIRQKAFRRRMSTSMYKVWHAVQKRDIQLRLRLGLGDPADTGQLWAVMGPVTGMLANTREIRVDIEPDFLEPVFELDTNGTVRVVPLQLIGLGLGLLLSPVVWRGLKQIRGG